MWSIVPIAKGAFITKGPFVVMSQSLDPRENVWKLQSSRREVPASTLTSSSIGPEGLVASGNEDHVQEMILCFIYFYMEDLGNIIVFL